MIQVKGTQDVIKHLANFSKEAKQAVIDQIEDTATNIEIKAIRNKGPELSFIRLDKLISKGGLRAVVGVQGDNLLAVYWEFGTGASAKWILRDYPQEVRDLAWKYKRPKDGSLQGKPYLFPAWFEEKPKFERELKKLLDDLTNKYNR